MRVSNMPSGELRRFPDIQRKAVTISTQQGLNGVEIHTGKFYDGFRRRGGEGCDGKKAHDMVETYADELTNIVLRGGGIVGEHSVLFAAEDEILTLSHSARDRGLFARGAVEAALWAVAQSKPGLYDMQDVLGLKA